MTALYKEKIMNSDLRILLLAQIDREKPFLWKDFLWEKITNNVMWSNLLTILFHITFIFALNRIFVRIGYRLVDRFLAKKKFTRVNVSTRRINTLRELFKNAISIVGNLVMILLIMGEVDIKIAPLLASAGVVSLAVAFGAQGLVKDVIAGLFIILEDQFAVGDVVEVGSYKGTVQMVGLRITKLVNWQGEVYIIPNGSITSITNFSIAQSFAVVDIPFKADESFDVSVEKIQQTIQNLQHRTDKLLTTPQILGVQTILTSEYTVRLVAKCVPNGREEVERLIRTEINKMKMQSDEKSIINTLKIDL